VLVLSKRKEKLRDCSVAPVNYKWEDWDSNPDYMHVFSIPKMVPGRQKESKSSMVLNVSQFFL
jgi:hypothetical protein